jgi:hypothetical protein
MFVCQWHLDIPYGKQGEAAAVMFDTLADFEAALGGMSAPQFRRHSDALAPYIVPGSQHWVVYRVIEEAKSGAGRS